MQHNFLLKMMNLLSKFVRFFKNMYAAFSAKLFDKTNILKLINRFGSFLKEYFLVTFRELELAIVFVAEWINWFFEDLSPKFHFFFYVYFLVVGFGMYELESFILFDLGLETPIYGDTKFDELVKDGYRPPY